MIDFPYYAHLWYFLATQLQPWIPNCAGSSVCRRCQLDQYHQEPGFIFSFAETTIIDYKVSEDKVPFVARKMKTIGCPTADRECSVWINPYHCLSSDLPLFPPIFFKTEKCVLNSCPHYRKRGLILVTAMGWGPFGCGELMR